jgi:hypothetical protein
MLVVVRCNSTGASERKNKNKEQKKEEVLLSGEI